MRDMMEKDFMHLQLVGSLEEHLRASTLAFKIGRIMHISVRFVRL